MYLNNMSDAVIKGSFKCFFKTYGIKICSRLFINKELKDMNLVLRLVTLGSPKTVHGVDVEFRIFP